MRVISSPSISTTGFATLIFAIGGRTFFESCAQNGGKACGRGPYSTPNRRAKARNFRHSCAACTGQVYRAQENCMPGAGTDKTKRWIETPAPVVVLVEPQLGENIGAAARAMANFGLARLRLVKPQQKWPNEKARVMAAGADRILDAATLYESLNEAIGDC